jgi:hypothetical protein
MNTTRKGVLPARTTPGVTEKRMREGEVEVVELSSDSENKDPDEDAAGAWRNIGTIVVQAFS